MLTPSQQSALDLTRHTAIIANAGSGKTRVLVERYLKILEEHPSLHPRNIAAITFTDASARDLRKKIAEAIQDKIKNPASEKKKVRFTEIRRQLSSAHISTIHSFCIHLLRTYPVEANVDAAFTILTSPEDALLREECVNSEFYRILKSAYADERSPEAKLLPAFRLFGRRRMSGLVHSFIASRFRIKNIADSLYEKNDEEIISFWNEQIKDIAEKEIINKIDISFFENLLREKTRGEKKRIEALDAVSGYRAAKSIREKLAGYVQLKETFFTDKNLLTGSLFPEEIRNIYQSSAESAIAPYRKYFKLIDAILKQDNPASIALYLDYSRQVIEVYTRVLGFYTEQKLSYSFLDYDDVIEYALRLVRIPEIQAELVQRFSHILIDEYQDTDAAQYEIAKALTGNFHDENRMTVVGDPKQSIYSFRNADLELYHATINEISSAHPDNSPVILSETFRMLSHPLAFINKVSKHLFVDDKFVPLVEGRGDEKNGSVELMILPYKPKQKEIEWVPGEDEEEELEDDIDEKEVELIALKIKNIIGDTSEKYFLMKEKELIKPQYRDIAILLRSRTHQPELETELRKNNIPFITYGGTGFYIQPEIIDITNYLRFLINTNDDIALAGLLRSPYFGLSDIDLFRLAPEYNSVSNLWQRFMLADDTKEYFTRAKEQLTENLQLAGRVSTQFLLQKIISESGMLGILQSLPGGDQKIANLEKYQRFAREFSSEGYSGTFDFIERITLLMERDDMEAQAEQKNDRNAVHLMTIHNAKGLEFPIVFLPYLHTRLLAGDWRKMRSILDKDFGIGMDLPDQTLRQPIVELIKVRSREKEIEEEKRIFYVAMTRARDHLILSASPKKSFKNTRMGWVLESLGAEVGETELNEIPFDTKISRYKSDGPNTTDEINFQISIIKKKEDIPLTEITVEEIISAEDVKFLLEDVEPSESIGRYSPTQLLTYIECPTKYYLRYQLGLPEEERLPYFNEADIHAENVQGSLFGQILHKILERSQTYYFGDFYDEKLLEEIFHAVCADLHLAESMQAQYMKRIKKDITTVLSSVLGSQALKARQYYTELALRSKLANGQILSGIIDRLYMDEDGVWNILDYKTDSHENVGMKKRYEFQMQFYAYLVSRLYNQEIVKAHILYTRTGNSFSFMFTQKELASTGKELQKMVEKIRLQKKAESLDYIERNLSHCRDCYYFNWESNVCIAGVGTVSEITIENKQLSLL